MRGITRSTGIAVAAVAIVAMSATTAFATPGRSSVCSNCHSGINVPVSATPVSTSGTNVTYSASAPTGNAIAVFDGSTKVATISSSSGQFTVASGKTYTVYAVKGPGESNGIGSTTVSPVAPPSDITAPTTSSDAVSSYLGSATIHLSASDNAGGSGVAHTYYRLDGGTQTSGLIISISTPGAHTLEFWSVDVAGNAENHHFVDFSVTVEDSTTTFLSVAGATRYETAVQASQEGFPDGAPCVVVATGANWPDALGGSALAAAVDGPILLTDANSLPAAVTAEIQRLKAARVYILGGTGAVGPGVESELRQLLGTSNVTRIGGANRYETAEMIAAAAVAEIDSAAGFDGTAFVATGANFPDALAAAPLSAAKGWPLFLAGPGGLSVSTQAAMEAAGVQRVLVLGGNGAIAGSVESALNARYGDANVERLAGANRFDTAVVVATYGCDSAGLAWDGLAIATGENFPDALAGGVMQGKNGSVMLLTPKMNLHGDTESCLQAHAADITTVRYLGGTGAVSDSVRAAVSAVLN